MVLNKAQKMVKIVEMMTRRGGVRASELAARFELDARTMRRYLADIRALGIPLNDEGRGEDRVLSIDSSWRRTGVLLSLSEVLSLHFGRTLFNFLDGTSFAEDLDGAIERLQPAISRAHADLARQLDAKFIAVPEPRKTWGQVSSDVVDEVVTALVYNNPVDASYRRINGVESTVLLHPYTLATYRQGLYLFALDVAGGRVKTYAVERFTGMKRQRGGRFPHPSGWEPKAHIADAFGIISGTPEDVVLAFSEKVMGYIRERTWHPTQTFRTLPDGRLELHIRVSLSVELVTWICGFGAEVQVLEPSALIERVSGSLQAAAALYS
jgi:proteasome accessory factor B